MKPKPNNESMLKTNKHPKIPSTITTIKMIKEASTKTRLPPKLNSKTTIETHIKLLTRKQKKVDNKDHRKLKMKKHPHTRRRR
eukprot:7058433-Ditylum_brightwellii.AAC.1